jgi:hypothetical protein
MEHMRQTINNPNESEKEREAKDMETIQEPKIRRDSAEASREE